MTKRFLLFVALLIIPSLGWAQLMTSNIGGGDFGGTAAPPASGPTIPFDTVMDMPITAGMPSFGSAGRGAAVLTFLNLPFGLSLEK